MLLRLLVAIRFRAPMSQPDGFSAHGPFIGLLTPRMSFNRGVGRLSI